MRFVNREQAAQQLAERLSAYKGRNPLVLAIPRGAVPMAKIIAEALQGDLDVVLVHKLRAPFQPELAIGAIDEAGHVYRHDVGVDVSAADLAREVDAQRDLLRRRRAIYTHARPHTPATGRIAIIVDDGIATGSSVLAAIRAVRRQDPARIVVATAVAPLDSLRRIGGEADEVVCLLTPRVFFAVGEFFENFSSVSDETVAQLLAEAPPSPSSGGPA
jgi:predicted phosphoribosyltransferase